MVLVTPYRKNKVSLALQAFFLMVHVVMALDFGFMRRKSVAAKHGVKLFTLLLCSGVCFLTLYEFTLPENDKDFIVIGIWCMIFLTQYIFNSLVLTINYEKSYYVLLETLLYVDDLLGVDSKRYNTDLIIIGSFSLSVSVRTVDMLLYCAYFETECTKSSVVNSMMIAHLVITDLIHFMLFITFHTVYCRLKMLNDIFKNCEHRIPNFINVFKIIADIVERVRGVVSYLYLMGLTCKIVELIGAVYLALLNMKNGENMFVDDQFVRTVYTAQVVILLFLPALSAGFMAAEVKKLKLILYEKLILERDEDQASLVELFLEYVSARPLQLRMAKVVPLDWTLPILVTDCIISYQIIIVQLTNLF